MAYASRSTRAIGSLMVSTMLVACSADNLVPPASIDHGTQVGSIQSSRQLPPAPIAGQTSQQAYRMSPAPVSQAGGGYLTAPSQTYSPSSSAPLASSAPAPDGDHYLRAPGSASGRAPATIPQAGVNMDEQFGFAPDESGVVGLAEEEETDIAEGVGDEPVVDGIGTDHPVALKPKTTRAGIQPMAASPSADDRVIVPPKRQGAGMGAGISGQGVSSGMIWDDNSPVTPPSRTPAQPQGGAQEVAMLRPNNPMAADGPMSVPDGAFPREIMPQSEVACRSELRRLGVEFRDLPRISQGESCGIDYPVKLSGLSGGIDVKPAVTLNCQVTLAFAKWVKNDLAVSARTRYFTGIQKIVPLGGYSCRKMNNSHQRYNPMSEHAHGNAIDVGAIVLKNGHDIDVRKKGLFSFREGGLLKSVRSDGCKYFSTVLGPGSNAEHWNHFHFDLRSRRGGRAYCD
ncbi:extensin family protein [Neorhizobium sp. NCHU2750]|uniref:extensin-like domain-containing protein n=1 Tax=Neorhizobium sp. NCHU2750 TaxID=1825976 RepID=UPI000E75E751|nr:extensin [Neorhizobium sp. NCHU2750]